MCVSVITLHNDIILLKLGQVFRKSKTPFISLFHQNLLDTLTDNPTLASQYTLHQTIAPSVVSTFELFSEEKEKTDCERKTAVTFQV